MMASRPTENELRVATALAEVELRENAHALEVDKQRVSFMMQCAGTAMSIFSNQVVPDKVPPDDYEQMSRSATDFLCALWDSQKKQIELDALVISGVSFEGTLVDPFRNSVAIDNVGS